MTEDNQIPYWQKLQMIKQGLLPKTTGAKPKKPIKKISDKKSAELKEQKEMKGDTALDRWFEERRLEMTGKCSLCQNKSYKNNDDRYRWSCHHLLDKRKTMFPSLALHPFNFLEVCHQCHQNIHGGKITFQLLFDSKERDIILPKLLILLPLCTPDEKKLKIFTTLNELVYGKNNI